MAVHFLWCRFQWYWDYRTTAVRIILETNGRHRIIHWVSDAHILLQMDEAGAVASWGEGKCAAPFLPVASAFFVVSLNVKHPIPTYKNSKIGSPSLGPLVPTGGKELGDPVTGKSWWWENLWWENRKDTGLQFGSYCAFINMQNQKGNLQFGKLNLRIWSSVGLGLIFSISELLRFSPVSTSSYSFIPKLLRAWFPLSGRSIREAWMTGVVVIKWFSSVSHGCKQRR